MSAINLLLSWFQTPAPGEDSRLQRLDGIKGHEPSMSDPRARVFAGRKKAAAA
jgi:hypothetical protein